MKVISSQEEDSEREKVKVRPMPGSNSTINEERENGEVACEVREGLALCWVVG